MRLCVACGIVFVVVWCGCVFVVVCCPALAVEVRRVQLEQWKGLAAAFLGPVHPHNGVAAVRFFVPFLTTTIGRGE